MAAPPDDCGQQSISLIGAKRQRRRMPIEDTLAREALILPTPDNHIRAEFDALMVRWRITPRIAAEVDDMAMLRLLARDSGAITVVPEVVVQDELREGRLQRYCAVPGVFENFYAITTSRRSSTPLLQTLLASGKKKVPRTT